MWPNDPISFAWGILTGALALFFAGFVQEFGRDCYSKIRDKVDPPKPPKPEPVSVGRGFLPTTVNPENCAWILEEDAYEKEIEGYSYYIERKGNRECFRMSGNKREFLMVKPDKLRTHA